MLDTLLPDGRVAHLTAAKITQFLNTVLKHICSNSYKYENAIY
jgi:hypothetical protein